MTEQINEKQNSRTVEQICMIVMAAGIIAITSIGIQWLRVSVACICAIVFLVPFFVRMLRNHRGISVERVCSILRKSGLVPVVSGDEIRWTSNGKESVLRIHSHCQVEIAREYDLPQLAVAIEGNERAALETMKEVYLAKVAVRKQGESSLLAFSTESLCLSLKELMTYLPMCLNILDLAESRQQVHVKEVRECAASGARVKIGFEHPDGSVR